MIPTDFLSRKSCETTFTQVLKKSLHEEGLRFLFKGWTPAFIRLGPNTVLMFVFYEASPDFDFFFGETNLFTATQAILAGAALIPSIIHHRLKLS